MKNTNIVLVIDWNEISNEDYILIYSTHSLNKWKDKYLLDTENVANDVIRLIHSCVKLIFLTSLISFKLFTLKS